MDLQVRKDSSMLTQLNYLGSNPLRHTWLKVFQISNRFSVVAKVASRTSSILYVKLGKTLESRYKGAKTIPFVARQVVSGVVHVYPLFLIIGLKGLLITFRKLILRRGLSALTPILQNRKKNSWQIPEKKRSVNFHVVKNFVKIRDHSDLWYLSTTTAILPGPVAFSRFKFFDKSGNFLGRNPYYFGGRKSGEWWF